MAASPLSCVALGLALAAGLPAVARAHPQDGPHTDVRITIDDESVSFQITMNLVFVDAIVDVPREDANSLHEVEHEPLREALFGYFAAANRVTIDGVAVAPVGRDFEGNEPDLALLPLFPVSGLRGLQKVRFVLDYPVKSAPKTVSIVWAPYPEDILLSTPDQPRALEIAAELDAFGLDSILTFTEAEPEHIWHDTGTTPEERFLPVPGAVEARPLPVPVISVSLLALLAMGLAAALASGRWTSLRRPVLVAAPVMLVVAGATLGVGRVELRNPFGPEHRLPEDAEAVAIFEPLHANIYRAFDYSDPEDVYDALARSVDGPMLDALYDQIYRSLIMHEEGGAVSRVQAVRLLSSAVESIGVLPGEGAVGFQVRARWQVDGSVYHWGHAHRRTNEYEARYTVKGADGGWRIAGSQVLEQFRVDAEPVEPVEPAPAIPEGTEF